MPLLATPPDETFTPGLLSGRTARLSTSCAAFAFLASVRASAECQNQPSSPGRPEARRPASLVTTGPFAWQLTRNACLSAPAPPFLDIPQEPSLSPGQDRGTSSREHRPLAAQRRQSSFLPRHACHAHSLARAPPFAQQHLTLASGAEICGVDRPRYEGDRGAPRLSAPYNYAQLGPPGLEGITPPRRRGAPGGKTSQEEAYSAQVRTFIRAL